MHPCGLALVRLSRLLLGAAAAARGGARRLCQAPRRHMLGKAQLKAHALERRKVLGAVFGAARRRGDRRLAAAVQRLLPHRAKELLGTREPCQPEASPVHRNRSFLQPRDPRRQVEECKRATHGGPSKIQRQSCSWRCSRDANHPPMPTPSSSCAKHARSSATQHDKFWERRGSPVVRPSSAAASDAAPRPPQAPP